MDDRIYNFSAGPAVLPLPVLEQAQRELLVLPGAGASILEISHRGAAFAAILEKTTDALTRLLNLPNNFRVLYLQGGSRLQFSMTAMNLLRGTGRTADYILTGSWGQKAYAEARREGEAHIAWDGKPTNYDRLPAAADLALSENPAYVHFTSNETIQGVQFREEPQVGAAPLVCDASSDFLCRPLDMTKYGLLYACAQKNAGPAGVTIVLIREDLLERSDDSLPGYLNYREHADNNSLYNTPPTFGIYLVGLVAEWLQTNIGGLDRMWERNLAKAKMLYDVIDGSGGFYRGHAQPQHRSVMNVTFRLPDEALEKRFLEQARPRGLDSLKGHRSVGGIRASIYNAMPVEGVEALRSFMQDFAKQG